MSRSGEWRCEEVARKARRVQDAVALVRGTASREGVRIEVAADGRITDLRLADAVLAQVISNVHGQALARAAAAAAELRRELVEEPGVARALRHLLEISPGPEAGGGTLAPAEPGGGVDEEVNPYALPVDVRRRYGVG